MAMDIASNEYKQAVASKGGSWSGGESATANTWGTEAVNPNDWQSGGWYTNPNSGKVEQWWASSGGSSGNTSSSGGTSASFDRMDRNANPGDAYFWDAADGWKRKDGGSGGMSLAQRPTVDLAGQYKSLYDELGIQSYRDQMTDFTNQINALNEEMNSKISSLRSETDNAAALINENPWSSAANRTGRLGKLEQQYNNKVALIQNEYSLKANNLQNIMSNVQNQYSMAMSDLGTRMNLYAQQYQFDLNNFDANLAQLNTLLDMGALDNASLSDLSTLASQTGMSADMISSMVAVQKNNRINPTLLTYTDDYGNVTATLMDVNTGNIINQQTLQGVAQSSRSGGSGGGSGLSEVNSLIGTRKAMIDQGLDTTLIDAQLAMYGINPDASTSGGLSTNEESALSAAYNLLNSDFGAITGIKNYGQKLLNNGQYSTTLAYYNSLINNLAIAKSGDLSGAKSDKDMELIKATIPLNTSMWNSEFEKNLRTIIADLEAKKNNSYDANYYLNNYGIYSGI